MPKINGKGIALLADPTRRQIIAILALHVARPSAIAKEIGRSRPATARQLRLMQRAGLISFYRDSGDGRGRVYTINRDAMRRITAWLAGTEVGRAFPEIGREQPADASDTSA